MIRRPESLRERTLLHLIESQQRTITDLTNRLMFMSGSMWTPPPEDGAEPVLEEPLYVSALDGLPPGYEEE